MNNNAYADEILIIVGSSMDNELGKDKTRDKESSEPAVAAIWASNSVRMKNPSLNIIRPKK